MLSYHLIQLGIFEFWIPHVANGAYTTQMETWSLLWWTVMCTRYTSGKKQVKFSKKEKLVVPIVLTKNRCQFPMTSSSNELVKAVINLSTRGALSLNDLKEINM